MFLKLLKIPFVLVLCLQILSAKGYSENLEQRAQIVRQSNDNLLVEVARDQNVTLRLMGESATVTINDVDMLSLLRRRQRIIANRQAAARREPLSLEVVRDQFRNVERKITKVQRKVFNASNSTRRGGLNQRILRRQLQRVERVSGILATITANLVKNECESSPCKNGGTCHDAYKGFQCECTAGWQGETCEDDVNECITLAGTDLAGCLNNGQCINTPGSYRCVCRNGFSGTHCRLRHNSCFMSGSRELCGEHGTCLQAANSAGYVCICDQGWTWADENATSASPSACTRDVNECDPRVNPCHDVCINLPGSFRCGPCPPGYTGDGRLCRDIDECAGEDNGGCSLQPRVACTNTEGSHLCGRCPTGWTGDGRTCTAADSNSCNHEGICHPLAKCEYVSETVVCTCPLGSFGHGYGADGCTSDSSRQPCEQHPCQNNGTCVQNGRGTTCICQPGYTGAVCNQSDACHPSPCLNDATCRLLPENKYQCVCPRGFTGTTCSHQRFFCGATLTGPTGQLHFPPNTADGNYQADERCPFIIRTTPNMVLNLTFTQFELQDSTDCSADFLQLHDGHSLSSRLIGRFCGSRLPLTNGSVITTQEEAFFWFRSDNETQGKGFHVIWSSLPFACGQSMNLTLAQTGVIRSPGYPGQTRPGVDCRWQLTAPFGSRLLLRFYDITLGSTETEAANCTQDSLIVYDSDRQLLRACQSLQPAPLYSSSNSLRLDFHTDNVRSDSSFQMHYEVVPALPGCGGVFTEARGRITGRMDAEVCLYLIEQPQGTQVELVFNEVNLMGCLWQEIDIFDGRTTNSIPLRQLCGSPEASELEPLTSTGNVMLVRYRYRLSGVKQNKNFVLSYNRVCTGNFGYSFLSSSGIITTPNYPRSYLDDIKCTYNLTAPLNTVIRLNITDLSLGTGNNDNETSYLDVYLSRDEKRHIVKSTENFVLTSHSNRASLVFRATGNGRGMKVEYNFIHTRCGGFLTEPDRGYMKQSDAPLCQYFIDAPGRKKISVRAFRSSEIKISIYDNSTSPDILLNTYTGTVDDVFDGDLLTINIASVERYIALLRFEIVEQDHCGGNFTSLFGYIKSPNWPKKYSADQDCEWIVQAPFGHRLELVVHNFTLEEDFTPTCKSDWLEIRNGNSATSPLIGRYCGTNIPSRLPSFGNVLRLKFHSDFALQDKGFLISWQQTGAGCGGKLSSFTGSIHSPHLSGGIGNAIACDWQIVVAEGSRVDLQLESNDEQLCNGQLTIFDGPTTASNTMVIRCNGTTAQPLKSSANRVLVRYDVRHGTADNIAFVLNYQTDCRVQLQGLEGAIESPNFPDNYPPNLDCEWDIRAGGQNHLQLAFSHYSVEDGNGEYCFDHLTLISMQDDKSLQDKKYCRLDGLAPITTPGNRLLLRFQSDYSAQEQGFRVEYKRVGCGEHFRAPGGSFESPKTSSSGDMDCDWVITSSMGRQIRLVLHEVQFDAPQGDCTEAQSKLIVSAPNGFNSSVVLYQTCREETQSQTFTSPGTELRVRFISGSAPGKKFFKASYVQVPASCGGYIRASSGVLTTPGFHNLQDSSNVANYSSNTDCIWTIEVTNGYGIRVRFEQFNLTDSSNCSTCFLELVKLDADDKELFLEKACGDDAPLIRMIHGQKLRVQFKAQAATWGRFAMYFERQCGGPLSTGEGYLQSRLDEDCNWLISLPKGSKLSLQINQLECPKCFALSGNCTEGLQLLNDDDEVILYQMCRDHPANLIVPASNVRILTKGVRLQAQYSTFENSCGGNITSARGSLSSPNYPDSYPANIECVWTIEIRPGNALEINFEAMDIVRSEHCNEDFLELRAGVQGQLLGLYCDKKKPEGPLVVQSQVWIKFRSRPNNTAGGFRLRWSYVHNIEITSGINGTIEPPPPLFVKGEDQPFTWRIFSRRDEVLVLHFQDYISGLLLFNGYDENALAVNIADSPRQFTSSSNVVFLKTVNAELNPFRITWHMLASNLVEGNLTLTTKECTREITMENAAFLTIRSPGYPTGYRPNLDCEWTVKPKDPARHVYVSSYETNLEDFGECSADYLNIQSSSDLSHWTNELRSCKANVANAQIHGTPNLRLQFHSDLSVNGSGFQAFVRTTCGSNMTDSVGTILASMLDTECTWHIDVRPGRKIDISIEYDNPAFAGACKSYGLIYDGLDDHAPLLEHTKFCNEAPFRKTAFRTSGSHAYIKYNLGLRGFQAMNRWKLTYREFNECNGEIQLNHKAPNYVIESPGFPNFPQPHSECTWLVMAPAGETIAATFSDPFELSARHCNMEHVELFDGSTKLARSLVRTCHKPQTTVRSSGNLMLVHYQSELNEPNGVFRLNLSLSACGGEFSGMSGTLNSENYPTLGGYPKPSVCVYSIRLPKDMFIRLNITDLHIPYNPDGISSKNGSDRLEIVDLMDPTQELMILDGSTVTPMVVTLNTNAADIRFVAIQNVNSYRGFRLEYRRAIGTCSRDVNGAAGDIVIPPMPSSTWLRFCRLTIIVAKGQRVRFDLLNLADIRVLIRNDTNRFSRRLETMPHFTFYNDANSLSKITEFRIDGYNGSGTIESTDNFMLVVVTTNQLDLSTSALRARYSSSEPSVCPPDIGDQAAGSLSIQTLLQLSDYHCTVRFVGTAGTTLTFKVDEYLFQTRGGPAVVFRDGVLRTALKAMYANVTNSFVSLATTSGSVTLLNSKDVKLLRFRATYRRHNCGGNLQAAEGVTIASPTLLSTLGENYGELECLWTLDNSNDYVLEGNVTLTERCDREYLVIFNGQREVNRICRGMTMNSTLLERPLSKILYHSESRVLGQSRFTLQARQSVSVAGNVVRVDRLPSPPVTIGSKNYLNNMERMWEFATKDVLSLQLQFQDRFFIETSPNCTKDRLTVERYDRSTGVFTEMVSLCGRQAPAKILVPSSKMRVIFRTDANVTGDGFSFQVSPSCDVVLQATPEIQSVGSPDWEASRGMQLNCSYVFQTAEEHQLVVSVKATGRSWTPIICTRSYFAAYRRENENAETNLGRMCPNFEVNGYGDIRLQYVSPMVRRFEIQYHLIRCGGSHDKPFILRPPQGEESGVYAHNTKCQWLVTAPPQHAIVIDFKYFDMEVSRTCRFDSLNIYRGKVASEENRAVQLCGNQTNDLLIMVDSNEALIALSTDSSNSARGFLASVRFTTNCNENVNLDADANRTNLMRSYRINATESLLCHFRATVPLDHRISLEMRKLQLNDADCKTCSYLEIIDNALDERQSLGRYYETEANRAIVFSSYTEMEFTLSAKAKQQRNISFELILQMERTPCGQTDLDMTLNDTITLGIHYDNTTRNIEGSIHCTWTIKVEGDVELDFQKLRLKEVSQQTGKCEDYLQLSYSYFSRSFCGQHDKPFRIMEEIGTKSLQLTFHSVHLLETQGFEVIIRKKPICNRNFTELTQKFDTSNLSNCTEYIRVPEGYSITFYVMSVLFNSLNNNYLNVTDLKSNKTLFSTSHIQWETKSRITTTNELRLDSRGVSSLKFFYFSTSNQFPGGCGGELAVAGSSSSYLENPSYEGRNSSLCSWTISVPQGASLRFSFPEFNMGSLTNCDLDNLQFYANNTEGPRLLRTFCGPKIPDDYTVTNNNVIVTAKKSPNFDGLGFKMDILQLG